MGFRKYLCGHTHTNHFSNIEYSHGRTFYKKNFFCVYSSTSLLWFLSSGVRPLGSRMKKIRALPLLGCPQPYWPLHRRGVASGFSRVKHFCTLLLSLCNWRFKISTLSQCLKITQNVAFELINFGIFHQFLSIKTDLSGNTVWPQASGFQKLAKLDHFGHF